MSAVAEHYRRPYLDSNVFLGWLKGEVVQGVDRKQIADHLIRQAQQGVYPLITSTLTLAEVHKLRSGPVLPGDLDEQILAFFESDFIVFVDVDRLIGEAANRLCRRFNIFPADAVHLASALRAGCDVLLAWDNRFRQVQHPDIRIEEPRILGQGELPFSEEDNG